MENTPLTGEDLEADVVSFEVDLGVLRSPGFNRPLCLTCTDGLQNPAPAGYYCAFWNAVLCVLAVGATVLAYPHFRDSLVLFVPTDESPTCSEYLVDYNYNYLYLFIPWYLVFISVVHTLFSLAHCADSGVGAPSPCWWKAPRQYIRNQRLYAAAAAGDVDAVAAALDAGGEATSPYFKWQPLLLCWLWEPPARVLLIYSALLLEWLTFFIGPLLTTVFYTITCHEGGDGGPELDLLATVLLPFQVPYYTLPCVFVGLVVTVGSGIFGFMALSIVMLLLTVFMFLVMLLLTFFMFLVIMLGFFIVITFRSSILNDWNGSDYLSIYNSSARVLSQLIGLRCIQLIDELSSSSILRGLAPVGDSLGAYNKHMYDTDDLGADVCSRSIEVTCFGNRGQSRSLALSAIEVTARYGHAEVMAELVGRVGQWDQQALDMFREAFKLAAHHGHHSVMEVFMSSIREWDPQTLNIFHDILELAVQYDRLEVVELLLVEGEDFTTSLPNDDHWLEIAIRHGSLECAKFWHAHGGDLNQLCEDGSTLREWGRQHGTDAITRWLPYDELERRYLERYQREGEPKYISETCSVWFAVDSDETQVALKCMQDRQYFESEVTTRRELAESCAGAIVPMLRVHVPESEHSSFVSSWGADCVADAFTEDEFPYVVTMTRGERSLAEIIAHERVAGRELDTIKKLARQIAEDLQILHAAGLVHGDIKPSNLLREQDSRALKLIDFDASAHLGGLNATAGACGEEDIERCTVGHKAEGSSAYIPPEGANRLQEERPCLEAQCSYDCWMLGATIYELLTGCRLFSSERVDSDAINPACLQDLINWPGFRTWYAQQQNLMLTDCSAPSIELERSNAIDLLHNLLACDATARPTMGEVLDHPFWKPAGDMGSLPKGEHRKLVLGLALSTLETHTANYRTVAATQFLDRCRAGVHSGQTWRDAVESQVVKKSRTPKLKKQKAGGRWSDVNDNVNRQPPMQCTECQSSVNLHDIQFQAGNHVLFYLMQGGWTAGVVSPTSNHKSDEYLIEAQIYGKDKVVTKSFTELCSMEGVIHDDCRHIAEGGTLQEITPNPPEEDCYDFELRTIWDVTKLFVPFGHKDFKCDFHMHDGSNLLNLLACISADENMVQLADKARNARNVVSHDGARMDLSTFKSATKDMQSFARMTGGTDTAEWNKLDEMIKAVEARGE